MSKKPVEKKTEKPLYACGNCNSKLSKVDELCHRCKRGVGKQIYPVPKMTDEEWKALNAERAFYSGISRLHKRCRAVEADKSNDARAFGTRKITQKYPKQKQS